MRELTNIYQSKYVSPKIGRLASQAHVSKRGTAPSDAVVLFAGKNLSA